MRRGLLLLMLLLVPAEAAAREARPTRLGSGPHLRRPIDAVLTRELATLVSGSRRITGGQVRRLAALATDSTGRISGSWALHKLLAEHATRLTPGAVRAARAALGRRAGPTGRPDNALYKICGKDGDHCTRNLELHIKQNGSFHGHTNIQTYSRGWLQLNRRAPLAIAEGSRVPASPLLSAAERATLEQLTPGQRLDRAVQGLLGTKKLGMQTFEQLSRSSAFYQPDQPDWSGVCYAWAHCALDARQSRLVDVKGPAGKRGLWFAGQWMSRADLGKWLMALSSVHAQGEGQVMWYNPEAQDLVKAALGYLTRGGSGFRADIGPALRNPSEVWFQPVVALQGGKISAVPEGTKQQILALARQPIRSSWGTAAGVEGREVRLIQFTGRYGDEVGDAHEGPPGHGRLRWAAYAVLDGSGKMLQAYLASDPRLAAVPGLPVRTSAAVPRDLFTPDHGFVDRILKGNPDRGTRGSLHGPQLTFFVGTVLARGVPGEVRAAFEREVGAGARVDAARAAELARRYPTVAFAYTPEQWEQHFGARGLEARRFGMVPLDASGTAKASR